MALMFQRLARNFIKNGYFPTDAETTRRVLSALKPAENGPLRILDPCCGEGVALAECKHHLGAEHTEAFGIEYDEERAWHAKGILDRCIHGDAQDCIVGRRQFGLLWLNPPYGDLVADKAALSRYPGKGRPRLEKLFYSLANPWLAFGGVLVLIIPGYSLDRELAGWIATHYERVRVFQAPEQRFQQVVVFGVRRRTADATGVSKARAMLEAAASEPPPVLPETWPEEPYVVPAAPAGEVSFVYSRLEPRQLAEELVRFRGLWERFDLVFGGTSRGPRRPLRAMSDWHLALALAAGQVSGVVRSNDGRVFVIKGDTHKEKEARVEYEQKANGKVTETRILTDKFVPVIRALDFTPGSPTFGQVLVIR
ncbi:MAG TPA: class I SAM-dependent methyltransferase [Thiotrichales bacterium]|nr:class I SAM-dependent methyltransferase [Thiotrichales bacterium]